MPPKATSSSAKSPRRFKAKSPELAVIYDSVTEKLYEQKEILKPFEYDFDEKTQTHTLTYEDCLRFVKKEGNRRIDVYEKENDQWVVSKEKQAPQSFRLIKKDGEVINTPVMWPVSCTNQSLSRNLHFRISDLLRKHEKKLPDNSLRVMMGFGNKKDLPPQVMADMEFNHEVAKLNVAISAIWLGKTKRFRFANQKTGVCKWWEKFVDREVLKMFVSVLGSSKNSCLSWNELAFATQDPDIDHTIKHVKELGGERVLLRSFPPSEWKNKKRSDLLPPLWEKVWDRTRDLPIIVQKNMALTAFQTSLRQDDGDDPFAVPWASQDLKNKSLQLKKLGEKFQHELQSPVCFYIFEHYKKDKKWSARELDMLFRFSEIIADHVIPTPSSLHRHIETDVVANTKKELDAFLEKHSSVADFISSYRQCFKDEFKKWSAADQSRFMHLSECMFRSWLENQPTQTHIYPNRKDYLPPGLAELKAKMEEISLNRELQETIKAKKAQQKRNPTKRRM